MLCRIVNLKVFVDVFKAVSPDTGRFHLVQSMECTEPDRVLMMPHYDGIRVVDADAVQTKPLDIEQ